MSRNRRTGVKSGQGWIRGDGDGFLTFHLCMTNSILMDWTLTRGWEQTNFVELWSVSRPGLAEMAIETWIWAMCQLTEKLFETSSVR